MNELNKIIIEIKDKKKNEKKEKKKWDKRQLLAGVLMFFLIIGIGIDIMSLYSFITPFNIGYILGRIFGTFLLVYPLYKHKEITQYISKKFKIRNTRILDILVSYSVITIVGVFILVILFL